MTENNNGLVPYQADEFVSMVDGLTSTALAYCSMKAVTDEERAQMYNAINFPEARVGDYINKSIIVKDIYCEPVEIVNESTGELVICPRIVLIDIDNIGYQAVSVGIYQAVKRLIALYGQPTWEKGVCVEVKQVGKADRKILTLRVVSDYKTK